MLSGKAGCTVLHMGDDPHGLEPVLETLNRTSIPVSLFHPAHVNRMPALLKQGMKFLKMGLPTDKITFSSDGQGSWSRYDETGKLTKIGVSSVSSIHQEFKRMVLEDNYSVEEAVSYITSNTAKGLQLYPKKGCIQPGADADLVLLDSDMDIHTVIACGKVMMLEKKVLKSGTYEQ